MTNCKWQLKPFATPITALIENFFTAFKYSSFIRGDHVYKDVWIPIKWQIANGS